VQIWQYKAVRNHVDYAYAQALLHNNSFDFRVNGNRIRGHAATNKRINNARKPYFKDIKAAQKTKKKLDKEWKKSKCDSKLSKPLHTN